MSETTATLVGSTVEITYSGGMATGSPPSWPASEPLVVEPAPPADALAYPRVRRWVAETPWAILPSKLAAILEVLDRRAQGLRFSAEEIRERLGAAVQPQPRTSGAVAVLPLTGVISQRADMMTDISGGTSTDRFAQQFKQLVNDPSIGSIVLDVDSPGGSVFGVEELASLIYQSRSTKPVVAVANSLAASAAYWIGSAASELVVTPGGQVGSIGVLLAHTETAAFDERLGVKTTLIAAGKYKTEGNSYEPLTDEARENLQGKVDGYYAAFTEAVARHRGAAVRDVQTGYGEGRTVGAKDAVRLGMADRIQTLDEVIRRLSSPRGRAALTAAEDATLEPVAAGLSTDIRRRRLRLAEAG